MSDSDHKHHFLDGPLGVIGSLDILGARLACEALIVQYAYLVDFGQAAGVPDLFTDDGVWEVAGPAGDPAGAFRLVGREQIRRRFTDRQDMHGRRSRHVMTNIGVNVSDEDHAQAGSYVTLYRADGVEGTDPASMTGPIAVGEYRDAFRREADGIWRFALRSFHAGFVAEGATL